jgi:hypothetical protein
MEVVTEAKADLKQLNIANGGSNSDPFSTIGFKSGGVQVPGAFTGVTLALQQSTDGGTNWVPVTDSTGAAVSLTVAPSKAVILTAGFFLGQPLIRFVSGAAEAAARVLTVTLQT